MLAILAMLAAVSIWLSLRRFRDVADEIGQGRIGDYAFSQRNIVPELSSVARDFDKLVLDLKHLSQQIRQSAEDNAHSFKTPLAAIQSSLSPVRKAVPSEETSAPGARSRSSTPRSHRLLALVNAAQRFDNNTADLIEAPRVPTNLTQLVGEATLNFREIMASRDIRLIRRLDDAVMVRAGKGMLEIGAAEHPRERHQLLAARQHHRAHADSRITTRSSCRSTTRAPAFPPRRSTTSSNATSPRVPAQRATASRPPHSGLGLWIVRRNVEALGGEVSASNRIGGGLSIAIVLPRNDD